MRPMLATRGDRIPSGPGWIHEIKWDGMRVLVDLRPEAARPLHIWSRNENDVTVSFPELHGLAALGRDVLLDGEVIALDERGVPSFGALADRMHVTDAGRAGRLMAVRPVTLLVFDLLRLDGKDLCGRPLSERRASLEGVGLDALADGGGAWQVPATYDDGEMLMSVVEQQGLEGVVSKRLASAYRPGQRTRDWLKFPIRPVDSFVVGGFRPEKGSRGPNRLGSLLVGTPTPGGLSYRGKVGSGVAGRAGQALREVLLPLVTDSSPFADEVPRADRTDAVWVRPQTVVDVQYLLLTTEKRLRQPAYCGMRRDLAPDDLRVGDT